MDHDAAEVPFSGSYWVVPGRFLAGEYPASNYFEEETNRKLNSLLSAGITCFIDLTQPQYSDPYTDALFELAGWQDIEVVYSNYAMEDFSTPDTDQIKTVLDVIDGALGAQQGVYLHCRAGIGRTGVIVGCYLVRHGLSGDEALERIKELRQHMSNAWMRSPETDAQVDLVRNWVIGA